MTSELRFPSTDGAVTALAATQGGVVTRQQAITSGMTSPQVDHRVASGRWMRIAHGSYRLLPMDTKIDRLRAAVAVLPTARVSHFSAAALHRFPVFRSDVVSVTVHASTTHSFPRVRVFRSRDLAESDVHTISGMPVTDIPRTIVDLGALLTETHLGVIVDDLVAAHRTTWTDVADAMEAIARRGKPGISKLRRVLEGRVGDDHPGSRLEAMGCRLLIEAGIEGFELECPIPWDPVRRFDVGFRSERLAIEWDSRRWHGQMAAFEADRRRDRDAVQHGWRLLRFTWDDVTKRPGMVSSTISSVLRSP